jgi:hypothetical protein
VDAILRQPRADRWRVWLRSSDTAVRAGRCVRALIGAGLATSLLLLAATLVLGRPVPGSWWLMAAAFPLLFAGQVWSVGIVAARPVGGPNVLAVFEGLVQWQRKAGLTLLLVGACAVLLAVARYPGLDGTQPAGSATPGCTYPVKSSNGDYGCESAHAHEARELSTERGIEGLGTIFLTFQLGVTTAELRRRRARRD